VQFCQWAKVNVSSDSGRVRLATIVDGVMVLRADR
jgi:hypothetical protein